MIGQWVQPIVLYYMKNYLTKHIAKSVQSRSFFWSVFFRIWAVYEDLKNKYLYSVRMWEKRNQKRLRIGALLKK